MSTEAVIALIAGTVVILIVPALFWSPLLSKRQHNSGGDTN
jgi:hypothetical protein